MKKMPVIFLLSSVVLVLLWNIEANYGFQWYTVLAALALIIFYVDKYIQSNLIKIGMYLVQTLILIFTVFLMLMISPVLTSTYSKIMYPLIFIMITGSGITSLIIFYKTFQNEG